MEVLAIFLCVLIASGSVIADPDGGAIGTDESSKVGEAVMENVSQMFLSDSKINNSADHEQLTRNNARKDLSDHGVSGRKPANSVEVETLERSPLVVMPSTVSSSGLKTKKKNMMKKTLIGTKKSNVKKTLIGTKKGNMKKTFIGAIVKDLQTSPPNISSTEINKKKLLAKYLKSFRRVIRPSRAGINIGNKTGKLLRRRRAYDVNDPYYASLNEHNAIFRRFPVELQYAIAATNHFEHALLLAYATSKGDRSNIDTFLSEYIQAKRSERKLLKKLIAAEPSRSKEMISNYKALRKGVAWLYVKLIPNLRLFFETPSAFLTEYDLLKRDELDSIDSFLSGMLVYSEDAGGGAEQFGKSMAAVEIKKEMAKEEEQLARVQDVDTTRFLSESYEAMRAVRRKLPEDLRSLIEITDSVEDKLVDSYVKHGTAPTKFLADYYAAKKMERELLKELVAEMAPPDANYLINDYKTLRKGRAWNYVKLQDRFKAFFRRPSAALLEYEALKRDELTSVDRFLSDETHLEGSEKISIMKVINQAVAHGAKITEEGRTTYAAILRSLPEELSNKILQTDGIERNILDLYAKSSNVPKEIVDAYNTARNEERQTLQKYITEHSQERIALVEAYKSLRKGVAWKFLQAEPPYVEFFQRPSTALTEFEAMKKEELSTLDSFLNGKPTINKSAKKRFVQQETWQGVARAVDKTNVKKQLRSTKELGRDKRLKRSAGGRSMFANTTAGYNPEIIYEATSAEETNHTTAAVAGAFLSQKMFLVTLVVSLLSQVIIIIAILVYFRKNIDEKFFKKKADTFSSPEPEKAPLGPTRKLSATKSVTRTKEVAANISKTVLSNANVLSGVAKTAPKDTHPDFDALSKVNFLQAAKVPPVGEATKTSKHALMNTTWTSELAKAASKPSLTTYKDAATTPGVTKVPSRPAANVPHDKAPPLDAVKGDSTVSLSVVKVSSKPTAIIVKENASSPAPAGDVHDVTKK